MSNLVRRLPTVPRTGDPSTLAWIRAAHEIIDGLQQGNGTTAQVIVSSAGSSGSVSKESLGLDKVDNTSDADKPVSTATAEAIKNVHSSLCSLGVESWDVSSETVSDIFAEPSNWFFIVGAGVFRGKDLAVGDAVLFYTDSEGDLDVIVIPDVSGKEDEVNKVENLDSPDHTTYPTTQAVADAIPQDTDGLDEGATNKYHTGQRVRDTPCTGLSTATVAQVLHTDLLIAAIGKLQAQITAQKPRNKIPVVAGRFYSNCNFGVTFSSTTVAAGQRRTIIYEPLSDMRINQIGFVLASAAGAVSLATLAVYEFDAVNPAQLNLLHNFGEITVTTAIGAKMITADYTFFTGRVYIFVLQVQQNISVRTVPSTSQLSIGLTAADGNQNTFWLATLGYSGTPAATIDTSTQTVASTASVFIVMRAA